MLQEREYRPIGSDRIVHVDFRLICATNIDLDTALRDGKLREDLYFRINTITLRVPPLRERTEDIPLLCDHFLEKFRQRYQKNVKSLAPSVYHLLIRNRWPGNVRELENAIERAVLVAKGAEIAVGDLPESIREESTSSTDFVVPPHRTLAEIEKMAILQTLQRTNWNKQEAAQILGLYRPTLYSKMKKHDIRDAGKSARTASQPPAPSPPTPDVAGARGLTSAPDRPARRSAQALTARSNVAKPYAVPPSPGMTRGIQLEADCSGCIDWRACVTDNSRAMAATIAGAVIGGIAGYFLFTERGRAVRRQFEPALDDFARELNSFRVTRRKGGRGGRARAGSF